MLRSGCGFTWNKYVKAKSVGRSLLICDFNSDFRRKE